MANFAVIQQAAPTSTGNQSFTSSGFGTPVAAMFIVCRRDILSSSIAYHTAASVGFTDGTNEYYGTHATESNVASTTICDSGQNTDAVIHVFNYGGTTTDCKAAYNAWVTDGVQINWSDAATASDEWLVTCILIGGDISNAHVGTAALGDTVDSATNVTAPGFRANVGWIYGVEGVSTGTTTDAVWSYGMFTNNGTTIQQYVNFMVKYDNEASGGTHISMLREDAVCGAAITPATPALDWRGELSDNANGFTITTKNAGANSTTIGYLALGLPDGVAAGLRHEGGSTSTGSVTYSKYGCTPEILFSNCTYNYTSGLPVLDSTSQTGMSIGVAIGSGATQEYCHASNTAYQIFTSAYRTSSAVNNKLLVMTTAISMAYEAELTSFNTGGFTLNWTDAAISTNTHFWILAIGAALPEQSIGIGNEALDTATPGGSTTIYSETTDIGTVVGGLNFLADCATLGNGGGDGLVGFGGHGPTTERGAAGVSAEDAAARADTVQGYSTSDSCILMSRGGGAAVIADVTPNTLSDNEVLYSNDSADEAYLMSGLLFGGSIPDVAVGTVAISSSGNVSVSTVGFTPDFGIFWWAPDSGGGNDAEMSYGFADNDSTVSEACYWYWSEDNNTTTNVQAALRSDCVAMEYNNSTYGLEWRATHVSWDSGGFTLNVTATPGTARTLHYLVGYGIDTKVKIENGKQTTTGTLSFTGYGFQPQAIHIIGTKFTETAPWESDNTSEAESFSLAGGIGTGSRQEFYHSYYDQANAGTSVTQALCDEGVLHIFDGAKATFVEANIDSFDSDGYTLNFTTVPAARRKFACLAFGPEPSETSLPSTAGVFKAYCIT